ncbi:MAG: hypothetical protein K0S92_1296, partial [Desertimonas sp.]|nr:hypothetical protein [Desertimonas sp.]
PRRAEHDLADHQQVDQQGHRPHELPRPGEGLPRTVHRRAGMGTEDFVADTDAVAADLATLRDLMQG